MQVTLQLHFICIKIMHIHQIVRLSSIGVVVVVVGIYICAHEKYNAVCICGTYPKVCIRYLQIIKECIVGCHWHTCCTSICSIRQTVIVALLSAYAQLKSQKEQCILLKEHLKITATKYNTLTTIHLRVEASNIVLSVY